MPAFTLRRLLAACALASMTACENLNGPALLNLPERATLLSDSATAAQVADKAIVILSFSHDRGKRGAGSGELFIDGGTWNTLDLQSDSYFAPSLDDLAPADVGSLWVIEITPGHHRVTGWSMRDYTRQTPLNALSTPLEFDAVKGEVIYLGNVHLDLTMGYNIVGVELPVAARAELRDKAERDIAFAERHRPAIAGRVRTALLPVGWMHIVRPPAKP